jgi:hypothetical protein
MFIFNWFSFNKNNNLANYFAMSQSINLFNHTPTFVIWSTHFLCLAGPTRDQRVLGQHAQHGCVEPDECAGRVNPAVGRVRRDCRPACRTGRIGRGAAAQQCRPGRGVVGATAGRDADRGGRHGGLDHDEQYGTTRFPCGRTTG